MAKALRITGGSEGVEIATFAEYFDKFFDCLNVGDFNSSKHSKSPYHSGSDFRLKVHSHVTCVYYLNVVK